MQKPAPQSLESGEVEKSPMLHDVRSAFARHLQTDCICVTEFH